MKTGINWTYNGKVVEELPEDCEAFVYLITNLVNHKMYVGKKLAKFKTTKKPLKGRKNKRRGTKESDWKTYWGSSSHLNDDVLKWGEHRFTREILHYCPSRGVASYLEAREQFEKEYLTIQLKKNHGNISKTADFIGMERSALHRKLKQLRIKGIN